MILLFALLAAALSAAPPGESERRQIRAALRVPDPLPELSAESFGRFDAAPGVEAERITYATEYGMRVPAILYLPKQRSGKVPGFIVVNGHGGDKYCWYALYTGVLYAKLGMAVLTYDPIGEGERNIDRKSGTRAHDRYFPPDEMARRMGGLMMTDLMQAVSYLAQRPEIDPTRIAAGGYSMGSFVLGLGCATETRLRACVLVGGGNLDGPGGYWDSSSKKMCQSIPYRSLQFLGDRPAILYALHADHAATFVFNGANDTVVGIPKVGTTAFFQDLQARVTKLRGTGRGVFAFAYEPGNASHRPYWVTPPVIDWLNAQFHFTNKPLSGPTVRIGDWAAQHHVEMDRNYVDEDREGGTRALAADVPGLTRAQLTAVPAAQWEAQKDGYTLEGWLARTRKLMDSAGGTR